MIVKYQTPEEIKVACELADKFHLYSVTGKMQDWFDERHSIKCIYIKFLSVPIGVFTILKEEWCEDYNCGTFIEVNFRRRGFGTELIKAALKDGEKIRGWTKSSRAHNFYNSCLQF